MFDDKYRTNEPASVLWTEQADNAAIYIGAISYGAQLVIAYLALYHVLYGKSQKFSRQYIAYIILMVILSTVYTVGNIHMSELVWIDERNYPGGPAYFFYTHNNAPPLLVSGAAAIIITFLADVCLLWRCYVVYHNKLIIIVFPALILLSTATMGIFYLVLVSSPSSNLGEITIQAFVAYRSLSAAFNNLVTIMMVARLFLIRKRIQASLGPQYGRLYAGLAALMIESALPHTIVSVLLIVLYCSKNIACILFVPLLTMIEAATPQLIILRVASGYALSKETIASTVRSSSVYAGPHSRAALDSTVPGGRDTTHTETTSLDISSIELEKAES